MKKWILRSSTLVILIAVLFIAIRPESLVGKPSIHSSAALLIDSSSGEVLISSNADTPLPAASLSKIMAQLIILDEIEAGHISWNDIVRVSKHATESEGVNLSLNEKDQFTVNELFRVIAVYSANDATVALAEHAFGSEERFVEEMNLKAKELGLSVHTKYNNATGSSSLSGGPSENYMTAKDVGKLSAHLIKQYPEILALSSLPQVELRNKGLYMSNTNWMLDNVKGPYAYSGADGLKTGYTKAAGYCLSGTVEKNGQRLIAIVMGAETQEQRFDEAKQLFDYGFAHSYSAKDWGQAWASTWYQVIQRPSI
ncbi:D-alanyl-D-alanine carboxypeptidase family protein [Paenibacillus sp. Marseille-Q4541]|uniref:D-alanyl-D-alanine carboxypeptidase family protein n=1 Tax=Paenibacillus sp. Marseille-Q4541 TaxID=2831522 RepID=UPI001BAD5B5B|nr:D-alanyl-D-alanine carboxypeptidase family protein [Paenibacillus sp. Marseille-Q4541]